MCSLITKNVRITKKIKILDLKFVVIIIEQHRYCRISRTWSASKKFEVN